MTNPDWRAEAVLTSAYRPIVEIVQEQLAPGESVELVATASDKPLRKGVLALTTARLLFVRERLLRSPVVIALPREDISGTHIADRRIAGKLSVDVSGTTYAFDLVTPRTRTWDFYWRLSGLAGKGDGADRPASA
jgi:hypothetical protein